MAVEGFECNWVCRLASLCVALTPWWTSERRARAARTRVRAVRGCGCKVEVGKLRPLEKGVLVKSIVYGLDVSV